MNFFIKSLIRATAYAVVNMLLNELLKKKIRYVGKSMPKNKVS